MALNRVVAQVRDSVSIAYGATQEFARIKGKGFRTDEKVQYDFVYVSGVISRIYIAVAPQGSASSASVWNVVRVSFTLGKPSSEGIAIAIAYDDRVTEAYTDD